MDLIAYAFPSCRDFLDSAQLHETSCIIADVQMPKMNGLELQHLLSTRGLVIPIIFITAYPNETIRTNLTESESRTPTGLRILYF
jgi:FixJ family two-component response regulator